MVSIDIDIFVAETIIKKRYKKSIDQFAIRLNRIWLFVLERIMLAQKHLLADSKDFYNTKCKRFILPFALGYLLVYSIVSLANQITTHKNYKLPNQ